MAQHLSPDVSAMPRPVSFWLAALLGLPTLNISILILVGKSGPLGLVAMALALIELVLLIALARRYRIGVLGALAAMLGNAMITTLVPILFLIWLFRDHCASC